MKNSTFSINRIGYSGSMLEHCRTLLTGSLALAIVFGALLLPRDVIAQEPERQQLLEILRTAKPAGR